MNCLNRFRNDIGFAVLIVCLTIVFLVLYLGELSYRQVMQDERREEVMLQLKVDSIKESHNIHFINNK